MDVQYPYADGWSRLQLLYRLPTAPAPRRLLIVCADASQAQVGDGWGSPVKVIDPSALQAEVEQGPARYEVVALPAMLDGCSAAEVGQVMAAARALLSPGGVLVGHVRHALALRRMLSLPGLLAALAALLRRPCIGRAGGCQRSLSHAGFASVQCFYVQPDIESPMGLIPVQPAAARAHFLRSVRSAQDLHGRWGHIARLLVARSGLGGLMQSHLFYWARQP